jgi:hypothetical protein
MCPRGRLFRHAGLPPRSNAEYILSTYALF